MSWPRRLAARRLSGAAGELGARTTAGALLVAGALLITVAPPPPRSRTWTPAGAARPASGSWSATRPGRRRRSRPRTLVERGPPGEPADRPSTRQMPTIATAPLFTLAPQALDQAELDQELGPTPAAEPPPSLPTRSAPISAALEPALVAAHAALGAPKRPGDLVLTRPPLRDELHHRVRLGHRVADRVVRDRHPGHQHGALPVARPSQAPRIDPDRVGRRGLGREQLGLGRLGHPPTIAAQPKNRTGLGPHPADTQRLCPGR
jgi:hypothetical protein